MRMLKTTVGRTEFIQWQTQNAAFIQFLPF